MPLGAMCCAPWTVQELAYRWFRDVGEWPHPAQLHRHVSEWAGCRWRSAEYDVGNALDRRAVYKFHPSLRSTSAKRSVTSTYPTAEAIGNGFRIAVQEEELAR